MKSLRDFDFKNKRVLVRCDFNVPLSDEGEILDDFRIKQTVPTIECLIKKGAKVILMSHLGRPGGKAKEELRLNPVQNRLMEYLDVSITKAPGCTGSEIEKWVNQMQPGEVLLLENLRFYKEEKENNEGFARGLAKLGDIYINDAFGACHRAHASIVGVPKHLPSGIGLLLEKEIKVLTELMKKPKKPLIAIVGGTKVQSKVKLADKISEIADFVLISGLIKKAIKGEAIQLKHPQKIVEPIDETGKGKDIGPKTVDLFKEKISQAETVFWVGPLGKIEEEEFLKGSEEIAKAIIKSNVFSVVGGGETVELIAKLGLTEKFNHVSTGGGAMLAFLSEEKLPGIEALK